MTSFPPAAAPVFTLTEQVTLGARYQASRDLFDDHEMARLRFIRWLYQTRRLAP